MPAQIRPGSQDVVHQRQVHISTRDAVVLNFLLWRNQP